MAEVSLAGRVAVNNRNRAVDDDRRGPADHVAAEIVEAAECSYKQPAAQFDEVLQVNLHGSIRLAPDDR